MRPQCSVISMKELVEQYGNPHFNVDRTKVRSNIWTKLAKALNIFQKKPYIEADKCVRCGICVNSCPVPGKAVDFRNGKKQPPVYDYKKCIRCFTSLIYSGVVPQQPPTIPAPASIRAFTCLAKSGAFME